MTAKFEKLMLRAAAMLLFHIAHPNWDKIDSKRITRINQLIDEIDGELQA